MDQARRPIDPGDPKLGKSDTIYLCVVDKDRNCVSLIQSNYQRLRLRLVPGDLGFALQNRGTLFALDEKHPNRLEPGKRPFHTIIPAMVTKDGKPGSSFGVMGGDMQPQGHVQVLVNMIDFGMNVQEAGEAPRIEHVGSATPDRQPGRTRGRHGAGRAGDSRGGVRRAEQARPQGRRGPDNGGGYQGILIDPETGVCKAARRRARMAVRLGTDLGMGRNTPLVGCLRPRFLLQVCPVSALQPAALAACASGRSAAVSRSRQLQSFTRLLVRPFARG